MGGKLSYSLHLIRPTRLQFAQLHSSFVAPLRRALSLPTKVHYPSVLHEFGVLPLAIFRMLLLLKLARRVSIAPSSSPCRSLAFSFAHPPTTTSALYSRSLSAEVEDYEMTFEVSPKCWWWFNIRCVFLFWCLVPHQFSWCCALCHEIRYPYCALHKTLRPAVVHNSE